MKWSEWLLIRDTKEGIVARDLVFHVRIYTEFTCLNRNLMKGKPKVFTTYISGLGYRFAPVNTYSTWKEAIAGHKKIKKDVFNRCNAGRVSDYKDQMPFIMEK